MNSKVTNHNYRTILQDELASRCRYNSRYSLRAFARDLNVSAPRLSNVLNGNFGLSREAAQKIAARLGLSAGEAERFCDLVESEHARTKKLRLSALERVNETTANAGHPFQDLSADHFRIVSDWYHFAIMELSVTDGFKSDPKWIADRLKISAYEVKSAIERLFKLELIEKTKESFKPTGTYFANSKGTPSEALRNFHAQLLEKAKSALVYQNLDERDFRSITIAIDPKDIPKAKAMIKTFTDTLAKELGASKKKKEVYQLCTQLFSAERSPIQLKKPVKKRNLV